AAAPPPASFRAEWREKMEQRARAIRTSVVEKETPTSVGILPQPLLRYNDPSRPYGEDTLWAWGSSGRPVALMALGLRVRGTAPPGAGNSGGSGMAAGAAPGDMVWSHEFVSLSDGRVAAEVDQLHWSPQKPGLELHPLPKAAA